MAELAVRVEGLGKQYQLGIHASGYGRLSESLTNAVRAPFRRHSPGVQSPQKREVLWAIREVSFEVAQGEVVGIIGRNGAGKTTLLKVLSRITEPTEGEAELRGRAGALLEVGTGFHPELTGRENILLNGAILGMRRREIQSKLDEIIEFAEVERFIDTPVKRYSSGMYVRLAFSVAAHLNPEILIVDEVLAVGDVAFQKKCLGRMDAVARTGRTVLFVSHNMGAVTRLCHRAILLERGRVHAEGPVSEIVRQYLDLTLPRQSTAEFRVPDNPKIPFQVLGVAVVDEQQKPIPSFELWDQAQIRIDFAVRSKLAGSNLSLSVSREGAEVFNSFDIDLSPDLFEDRPPGRFQALVPVPRGLLPAGVYTVSVSTGMMAASGGIDIQRDVVSFEVTSHREDISHKSYSRGAAVLAQLEWHVEKLAESNG